MRLAVALFTFAGLSACSLQPSDPPPPVFGGAVDEWRHTQAMHDVDAILEGMQQARKSQEQFARSTR